MIKSTEITRLVPEEKIKFEGELIMNAMLNRKTLRLKSSVLKNTNNLFDTNLDDTIPALELAGKLLLSKNWKLEYQGWKLKKELAVAYPEFFF